MNGILNYSFLKVEIKGLYELTVLMNIRYCLGASGYSGGVCGGPRRLGLA